MKIWGGPPKVGGVYDKQKNLNKVEPTSALSGKKDVVSISNHAKDFQTVMKTLREIPDIRQDKVNDLAEKYQAGNYDVSGKDTADRVIKSILDRRI
jgi:negative regulator of flagellin synthesis FlgM